MALRRLGTGRISRGFMALLKLATMNIFTITNNNREISSHITSYAPMAVDKAKRRRQVCTYILLDVTAAINGNEMVPSGHRHMPYYDQ